MHRDTLRPIRRARLIASLVLACTAGFGAATPALAEAPQQLTQVPGYYRTTLGKFEITALYDGPFGMDPKVLKYTSQRDIQRLFAKMFVNSPPVQTAVNAFLVNTGSKLILVDTGAAKLFGPQLGNVVENLRAAGYRPEQVDIVLLTHLHGDHVNGLVGPAGERVFANAQVFSSEADNAFWLSAEVAAKAAPEMQGFFKMSRDAAAPYIASGQWKTFTGEEELAPGIHSVDTHGHTPGHTSYLLDDGGEKLLILGDIVHNHAVQFARPETAIEFDVDPKQAVAARKKAFQWAAKERFMVAGMHLPFPGLGHVRKDGKAFAWVPAEFAPVGK